MLKGVSDFFSRYFSFFFNKSHVFSSSLLHWVLKQFYFLISDRMESVWIADVSAFSFLLFAEAVPATVNVYSIFTCFRLEDVPQDGKVCSHVLSQCQRVCKGYASLIHLGSGRIDYFALEKVSFPYVIWKRHQPLLFHSFLSTVPWNSFQYVYVVFFNEYLDLGALTISICGGLFGAEDLLGPLTGSLLFNCDWICCIFFSDACRIGWSLPVSTTWLLQPRTALMAQDLHGDNVTRYCPTFKNFPEHLSALSFERFFIHYIRLFSGL